MAQLIKSFISMEKVIYFLIVVASILEHLGMVV